MFDFSVLMPSFDRRDTLARVLEAWEKQRDDGLRFELIVVDDGSSDGTAELLAAWRGSRFPLRFAVQQNAGPAAARNRALAMARGEWVLFTGDDIEPAPDLLAEHRRAHHRYAHPGRAILGLTRWPDDLPQTATMRHIDGPGAEQFSYHYLKDGAVYDFRHFYTSNVSLRREMTAKVDGFSRDFAFAAFEDAEYAHRLSYHGLEILYHAAAVASHHHPYGARAFYRRQQRCGAMAALLYRKHPALKKWLGLAELERERLASLQDPPTPSGARDELARKRERAILLAERLDAIDPPGIDPLLGALFRFGYEDGLAHALYDGDSAAALLLRRWKKLAPVALEVGGRLASESLWLPAADIDLFARS